MDKAKRKAIIAGNWKMNKTASEAAVLVDELIPAVKDATCEVVICTPFTDLVTAVAKTKGTNIHVGAENVHFEKSGAFTGEISADMLVDLGVEYVIVGHSERRQYFAETDQTVNKGAMAARNAGLKVILCVGESLQQREEGVTEELVRMQVKIALNGVTADELKNVVIAYEPIWAIGTGKTATADQAEEVCAQIRKVVGELYGEAVAEATTVQYGGSMNPKNAEELLGQTDVDGGLIGGAALKGGDLFLQQLSGCYAPAGCAPQVGRWALPAMRDKFKGDSILWQRNLFFCASWMASAGCRTRPLATPWWLLRPPIWML